MAPELISLLAIIFGTCSLLIIGLSHTVRNKNSDLNTRLQRMREQWKLKDQVHIRDTRTGLLKILSSLSQKAIKYRVFNRFAEMVGKNLSGADIPLKSEEYIIMTAGASLLTGVLIALILMNIFLGVISAAFVVLLSVIWISMAKIRRLDKFNSQLGDSLMIMSNSLRAGFSFIQAMDMIRRELPDPIAKEFGRTFQEMSLGTPTEEALENMSKRVGSIDLDLIITAVMIQRQVGGNLAEILDNIATTIRERIRINGEIKTITAQGKISGIVIGLLPFALAGIMSIMSPEYLKPLITEPIGQFILASALALEIIGILLIRKIIDIKV